jgi:hypothetical protein
VQQTVDADAKELTMVVDADLASVLETILVSGLSYFFYAVAETVSVLAVAVVDVAMTVAYGSSSYCSSAVASATTEVDADATTTAATNII